MILPSFLRHPPRTLGRWCRWQGPGASDAVALTFDDGPSGDTVETLRLLDHLEMRATFFLLGRQVQTHPELVSRMHRAGHEVGTHGFEHHSALLSSPRAVRLDLGRAVRAHQQTLGRPPRFYRPPFGHVSAATLLEARRQRLELVLWSQWGKEFAAAADPDRVLERLASGLHPGAIVLLHDNDVSCRSGTAAITRAVLPGLRALLAERGLHTVPVGDLIGIDTAR